MVRGSRVHPPGRVQSADSARAAHVMNEAEMYAAVVEVEIFQKAGLLSPVEAYFCNLDIAYQHYRHNLAEHPGSACHMELDQWSEADVNDAVRLYR